MADYGTKEAFKYQSNLDELDVNKFSKEELLGLYLLGEISAGKLAELFRMNSISIREFVGNMLAPLDKIERDESQVEPMIW